MQKWSLTPTLSNNFFYKKLDISSPFRIFAKQTMLVLAKGNVWL